MGGGGGTHRKRNCNPHIYGTRRTWVKMAIISGLLLMPIPLHLLASVKKLASDFWLTMHQYRLIMCIMFFQTINQHYEWENYHDSIHCKNKGEHFIRPGFI